MDFKMLSYGGLSILVSRNHTNGNHKPYERCPYSNTQNNKAVNIVLAKNDDHNVKGTKLAVAKNLAVSSKGKGKGKKMIITI